MLYLSGDHLRVHRRRYGVPYTHHAINFPNGQAVEFGGSTTTSGNTLKFINGDRRKFFEESTMTARHTLELLSLLDILPFELYRASTQLMGLVLSTCGALLVFTIQACSNGST